MLYSIIVSLMRVKLQKGAQNMKTQKKYKIISASELAKILSGIEPNGSEQDTKLGDEVDKLVKLISSRWDVRFTVEQLECRLEALKSNEDELLNECNEWDAKLKKLTGYYYDDYEFEIAHKIYKKIKNFDKVPPTMYRVTELDGIRLIVTAKPDLYTYEFNERYNYVEVTTNKSLMYKEWQCKIFAWVCQNPVHLVTSYTDAIITFDEDKNGMLDLIMRSNSQAILEQAREPEDIDIELLNELLEEDSTHSGELRRIKIKDDYLDHECMNEYDYDYETLEE